MVTITLSQPLEAHGETLAALELREPTGADIVACGVPFRVERRVEGALVEFDAAAVRRYISRLANIPAPSVDKLCAPDWMEAMTVVTGFFETASRKISSTGTGSSPAISEI